MVQEIYQKVVKSVIINYDHNPPSTQQLLKLRFLAHKFVFGSQPKKLLCLFTNWEKMLRCL